jgi:low affinity Fe/Cu permease
MGLDDQILFGLEWAVAISFGVTIILFFYTLINP